LASAATLLVVSVGVFPGKVRQIFRCVYLFWFQAVMIAKQGMRDSTWPTRLHLLQIGPQVERVEEPQLLEISAEEELILIRFVFSE